MAESTEKAAKNKKINRLKAADIDTKLNELRTSQGGLKSSYAQMLLKRKKTLGK
jgi:hypothetical protein